MGLMVGDGEKERRKFGGWFRPCRNLSPPTPPLAAAAVAIKNTPLKSGKLWLDNIFVFSLALAALKVGRV